jgi:hypothetical protein
MLPKKQAKAYREFYETARNNDVFPERQTILIHLAAAMAMACYP